MAGDCTLNWRRDSPRMQLPLRLLVILPTLNGGGAERSILTLVGNLDPRSFVVTLFIVKTEGEYWSEIPRGVGVHTAIGAGRRMLPHLHTILYKACKLAGRADVIIGGQELTATYIAVAAGRLTRRPVIGFVHTDLEEYLHIATRLDPFMLGRLYPQLDKAVAVSTGVAKSLVRLVPELAEKTMVLSNPVDVGQIVRQSMVGPPPGAPPRYILGMGRLCPEKRFDVLIEAYATLHRSGFERDLVILGEGPERFALEQLAKQRNISNRVHLPGFMLSPHGWLRGADIFVLTSQFEGFGLVLVEALAVGTPVVAVDAVGGGPREILSGGDFGVLVPPGDTDALAEGVRRLANDQALDDELKNKGIIRSKHFDISWVIPSYEKLFIQVAQRC